MIYRLTKVLSSAGCDDHLNPSAIGAVDHLVKMVDAPVKTVDDAVKTADDAVKAADRTKSNAKSIAPDGCGGTSSNANDLWEQRLGQVRNMLTGERVNTEVRSIVAGASPGVIWVDDEVAANTALLYSFGQDGFYIVGAEQPGWAVPALAAAIEDLPQAEVTYIEVSSHSDNWDRRLRTEFAKFEAEESVQFVYRRAPLAADLPKEGTPKTPQPQQTPQTPQPHSQLQSGRRIPTHEPPHVDQPLNHEDAICWITPQWLQETAVNTEWLQTILTTWWGTLDCFFEHGTGYAAVVNGEAVSCCYTSFAANDHLWALGVDTQETYRRRGWARKVTEAMVCWCDDQGITMDWDCMATNLPSQRLAEGRGFALVFTYAVFSLANVISVEGVGSALDFGEDGEGNV